MRNDPQVAHGAVLEHIRERGAPEGIYSVAGGNSGVGKALEDVGIVGKVVFICSIPEHCIDVHRLPLFIARSALRDLIAGLHSDAKGVEAA
ncbi:MAG: hypothetical protein IOD00_07140 [Rhodobacter sp.]|nr:hypothetical protein [Rhodobacter sp.]MCA3478552.1 hypothetical protein [Rhodobacter sp.]MCA3480396.1 hypothetical protein [Rhodobacter sp.]